MSNPEDVARESAIPVSGDGDGFGGLFDGFEAYRTPADEDYRALLTGGLVVVDTNVLLNLYRYNDQTRDDLLSVLRRLGERLWVPRQVVEEFWRNREAVLRDPRDTTKTIDELNRQRDRAISTFRTWTKRVGLSPRRTDELVDVLSGAFGEVVTAVALVADHDAAEFARNTNKDPVIAGLDEILRGRVGGPLSKTEHEEALAEAKRRGEAQIPPGYKDAGKESDEAAAGDYLLWAQVLREARRRRSDVLLVTGDVKEDWWRRERGELRGPRRELVEELQSIAGVKLYMLRPDSFMLRARGALQVKVRDESVEDVERVDRSLAEADNAGWTIDALSELLDRLSAEGWTTQAAVIMQAAEGDGFVGRHVVYALGGYDDSRSLRGFTRPVSRITRELRDQGIVAESAEDALSTVYDQDGLASGFSIPPNLTPLIRELTMGGDTSRRYKVLDARPYDPLAHREGSVGRSGKCALHGCGEAAVATMTGEDRSGGNVVLSVCERGVEEYDLRARFDL
jgi:predicted nucleic acid-binding protein